MKRIIQINSVFEIQILGDDDKKYFSIVLKEDDSFYFFDKEDAKKLFDILSKEMVLCNKNLHYNWVKVSSLSNQTHYIKKENGSNDKAICSIYFLRVNGLIRMLINDYWGFNSEAIKIIYKTLKREFKFKTNP
jgi:hypothetical protein